jgi:hypothetical protein
MAATAGCHTTSRPQKGACGQNSTAPVGPHWRHLAVEPIPPADWGTRSTRSHRPRPSVSAPNTRSLIYDHCGVWGGGGASRSGPGPTGRGWGASGFGFESVPGSWRGFDRQYQRGRGGRGRPTAEGAPPAKGKSRLKKLLDQLAAEEGSADEAAKRYLIPNRVVAKGAGGVQIAALLACGVQSPCVPVISGL